MKVEFHPRTVPELNAAVDWYNHQQPGLGDALRLEVYATVERIRAHPDRFRIVADDIRRCLVHRFPYSVLFRRATADRVRVLVIRHHRQHPERGLSRR